MKSKLRSWKLWAIVLLLIATTVGILVSVLVLANRDVGPWTSDLTITPYADVIRFEAGDPVATLQVQIYDLSGKKVWDSGVVSGWIVDWDRTNKWGERLAYGPYIYVVQGWSTDGGLVLQKKGKLVLLPGDEVQLQGAPTVVSEGKSSGQVRVLAYDHTGDWTVSGKLGVGTDTPAAQFHVVTGLGDLRARFQSPGGTHSELQFYDGGVMTGRFLFAGGNVPSARYFGFLAYQDKDGNPQPIRFFTLKTGGSSYGDEHQVLYLGVGDVPISYFSGRVGIGAAPSSNATFEVKGSATNLLVLKDPADNTVFRVEKTGTVLADGAYYGAGYYTGSADVAERINTSEWVEKGDVVEIDPDHPGFFRKARSPYSTKVAGIISTSPGVVLGNSFDAHADQWKDNRPAFAIAGRVPVKATTENGPIQSGDLLVSSSTPGYAMRCGDPQKAVGAVIGKALEPLEEGVGTIIVQAMLR